MLTKRQAPIPPDERVLFGWTRVLFGRKRAPIRHLTSSSLAPVATEARSVATGLCPVATSHSSVTTEGRQVSAGPAGHDRRERRRRGDNLRRGGDREDQACLCDAPRSGVDQMLTKRQAPIPPATASRFSHRVLPARAALRGKISREPSAALCPSGQR